MRITRVTKTNSGEIVPGKYEVPGGTLTVNEKGISTYVGSPYQPIQLKKKYL